MRRIRDINEHSVFAPGLTRGSCVLDVGANKGGFGRAVIKEFGARVFGVEANPRLSSYLKKDYEQIMRCALDANEGLQTFNIGTNDEASSLLSPCEEGSLLTIQSQIQVRVLTLDAICREFDQFSFNLVKLDIEGAELKVLLSIGDRARDISPQWTVEFHDHEQFKLCNPQDVDAAIRHMRNCGFSVLIRDWPHRTNVLFVDRVALSLGLFEWFLVKFRYQYFAWLWRKLNGL